jgi:hypothetical protein
MLDPHWSRIKLNSVDRSKGPIVSERDQQMAVEKIETGRSEELLEAMQ